MTIFFPFPTPTVKGTFIARPQRFLINASFADGSLTVAYCANPGSFRSCLTAGRPILLWRSPDPNRKRQHTWLAIKLTRTWIGTDTHLANKLVEKTLINGLIKSIKNYKFEQREPRQSDGRRLDFLLKKGNRKCYVEVKSATIADGLKAQFPDSISVRACAHLDELTACATAGHRAILIFLVQRDDVHAVHINRARDLIFTESYKRALLAGVEVIGIKHRVTPRGFGPPQIIPVL